MVARGGPAQVAASSTFLAREASPVCGRLAQLGRAAALHAVGQGFESLVAHSSLFCSSFLSLFPSFFTLLLADASGAGLVGLTGWFS